MQYSEKAWKAAMKDGHCPHGCVLDAKACAHLDNYLNNRSYTSVRATPIRNIEMFENMDIYGSGYEAELTRFVNGLHGYTLTTDQVRILVGRHVRNWTFAEIAKEFNLSSPAFAHKLYKKAVTTLKKEGYTLEG